MGKIIISQKILGANFMNVVLSSAENLMKEKCMNAEEITNELNKATSEEEFFIAYKKYFGNEIKIIKN
jgi:hypothetical protein